MLRFDPLAEEVIAVFVFEQVNRRSKANAEDHLQHRLVLELEIDVERFFILIDMDGFDGLSLRGTKRNHRVAIVRWHRVAKDRGRRALRSAAPGGI
jgi:hypothetical protein